MIDSSDRARPGSQRRAGRAVACAGLVMACAGATPTTTTPESRDPASSSASAAIASERMEGTVLPTGTPVPRSALTPAGDGLLYALGTVIGTQFRTLAFDEAEAEEWERGFSDAVLGRTLELDPNGRVEEMEQFRRQRLLELAALEKAASAPFLDRARAEPGAVETETGMIWTVLAEGQSDGESPTLDQWVRLRFHGVHRDGRIFDSTFEGTREVRLASAVLCWREALPQMTPGGRVKIVCPPHLAYGDLGIPPRVLGGEVLVFDLELISSDDLHPKKRGKPISEPAGP